MGKAALKISGLHISIIVATLFIMLGVGILEKFRETDPTFMADQNLKTFNNTFNKLQNLEALQGRMRSSVENVTVTDQLDSGLLGSLGPKLFNVVKSSISNLAFVNEMIEGLSGSVFGVPGWVVTIITLLLTTTILYAIISSFILRET